MYLVSSILSLFFLGDFTKKRGGKYSHMIKQKHGMYSGLHLQLTLLSNKIESSSLAPVRGKNEIDSNPT